MRKSHWTPSIVPGDNEQTVYLVAEDFGKLGRAWREADYEATDLETVIEDLLSGQYNNPICVVAFNTAERWSEDVSQDVAHELRRRCDLQLRDVPSSIQDFVERQEGAAWRQLTLRLARPLILGHPPAGRAGAEGESKVLLRFWSTWRMIRNDYRRHCRLKFVPRDDEYPSCDLRGQRSSHIAAGIGTSV